MNAPTAFLTRVRAERRALQTVNEAAPWSRLHGVGDEALAAWSASVLSRVDIDALGDLVRAVRRLRTVALLEVDRSRFVGTGGGSGSRADVRNALDALSERAGHAAATWDASRETVSP